MNQFEVVVQLGARVAALREQARVAEEQLKAAMGLVSANEPVLPAVLRKPIKASVAAAAASPKVPKKWPSPNQDMVRELLGRGPMTMAELRGTLVERLKTTPDAAYQTIASMKERGLIVKRECPQTRLDKWFLVQQQQQSNRDEGRDVQHAQCP